MSDKPQFEIPEAVRELAERNVEQARSAYGQFMDMARKVQDTVSQIQFRSRRVPWPKVPSNCSRR
jgi:hypothetical protein